MGQPGAAQGDRMLDRIKASLPSLAPAEQRVARLVLLDPRAFANLPVSELSDRAHVSKPTVVRFCRSMGYDGLSDFKLKLAGTVSEGLVAYFPFEEDAADHSGHWNAGKVVGAEFQRDEATGKKALQFTGTGASYVVVPRTAALEPTDGITISMWVKGRPGQPAGHGWGTVLRKADSCQSGYYIRGGGSSSFQLHGANPCSGDVIGLPFAAFNEQQWQHIVGTYSRTEGMARAYQNGELVNQQGFTKPLLHSGDLYIGGAAVAGDDGGFRGLIAEVRIYNRGLSPAEVRVLSKCGPTAH